MITPDLQVEPIDVSAWIDALQDTEATVRTHAARSLGQLGVLLQGAWGIGDTVQFPEISLWDPVDTEKLNQEMNAAVPALIAVLPDPDATVRAAVAQALGEIG